MRAYLCKALEISSPLIRNFAPEIKCLAMPFEVFWFDPGKLELFVAKFYGIEVYTFRTDWPGINDQLSDSRSCKSKSLNLIFFEKAFYCTMSSPNSFQLASQSESLSIGRELASGSNCPTLPFGDVSASPTNSNFFVLNRLIWTPSGPAVMTSWPLRVSTDSITVSSFESGLAWNRSVGDWTFTHWKSPESVPQAYFLSSDTNTWFTWFRQIPPTRIQLARATRSLGRSTRR